MIKRLLALIMCLTVIIGGSTALCEDSKVFILCNPETPVNVRKSPKRGSEIIGRLDFGDWTETDGKERNGYVHVINITEEGEGWIFAGYIVEDEPKRTENAWASISASGRVMTYRWIAGKRNGLSAFQNGAFCRRLGKNHRVSR